MSPLQGLATLNYSTIIIPPVNGLLEKFSNNYIRIDKWKTPLPLL